MESAAEQCLPETETEPIVAPNQGCPETEPDRPLDVGAGGVAVAAAAAVAADVQRDL